jgi:hypothetical protein
MKFLKGESAQKMYLSVFFFTSPLLIQFQNVLHVSSQVFKILDLRENVVV